MAYSHGKAFALQNYTQETKAEQGEKSSPQVRAKQYEIFLAFLQNTQLILSPTYRYTLPTSERTLFSLSITSPLAICKFPVHLQNFLTPFLTKKPLRNSLLQSYLDVLPSIYEQPSDTTKSAGVILAEMSQWVLPAYAELLVEPPELRALLTEFLWLSPTKNKPLSHLLTHIASSLSHIMTRFHMRFLGITKTSLQHMMKQYYPDMQESASDDQLTSDIQKTVMHALTNMLPSSPEASNHLFGNLLEQLVQLPADNKTVTISIPNNIENHISLPEALLTHFAVFLRGRVFYFYSNEELNKLFTAFHQFAVDTLQIHAIVSHEDPSKLSQAIDQWAHALLLNILKTRNFRARDKTQAEAEINAYLAVRYSHGCKATIKRRTALHPYAAKAIFVSVAFFFVLAMLNGATDANLIPSSIVSHYPFVPLCMLTVLVATVASIVAVLRRRCIVRDVFAAHSGENRQEALLALDTESADNNTQLLFPVLSTLQKEKASSTFEKEAAPFQKAFEQWASALTAHRVSGETKATPADTANSLNYSPAT